MLPCVETTLKGRCREKVYPSSVAEDEHPRCYFHKKIRAGLININEVIVLEPEIG